MATEHAISSTGRCIRCRSITAAISQSWRRSQSLSLPSAIRFRTHVKAPRRRHPSYPNNIPSSPKGRTGQHLNHAIHLLRVTLRVKGKSPPYDAVSPDPKQHDSLTYTLAPYSRQPHNLRFYLLFPSPLLHLLLHPLEIRPIPCRSSHRLGDLCVVELVAGFPCTDYG
jgi:hypothetical protein